MTFIPCCKGITLFKSFFFFHCDKEVFDDDFIFYFILSILKNKFIENGLLYAKKRGIKWPNYKKAKKEYEQAESDSINIHSGSLTIAS